MSNLTRIGIMNPRLFAVLLLGFSSGLPLALTGSTLQAWFTEAHISLVSIGALSLLGIPYTFKFLWAPLLDQYGFPFLGKRRGWILSMQIGISITLFFLAQLNPTSQTLFMGMIAVFAAILSATQDCAIDAYRTDILNAQEKGIGAAYTIFGYRIASLISGGLALILADHIGWKYTYEIMACLLLLNIIQTIKSPAPKESIPPTQSILTTTKQALADLLQREKILLIFLFIVLYKFGDALALQLMTNFLLHGLGFSLTELGIAYKTVSMIATILGAFVGGAILLRCRLYHGLLYFGLAQTFSNLSFIVLAAVGKNYALMASTIFIENFCGGMSTAALLAFMMSLCHSRYTATQIALLSAIASLGRVYLGPLAGYMVENLGWIQFYFWSFILCFPGLIILLLLKPEDPSYAPAITN